MSKFPLMTTCRRFASLPYKMLFPANVVLTNNVNLQKLPRPLIIVSNHHSYHDPLQIIVQCKFNIRFLAKTELFRGLFGWFFKGLGLIEVDRKNKNSSYQLAKQALKQGDVLAIFPESTTKYKKKNELHAFRYGASNLAIDAKSRILPIAITGRPTLFQKKVTIRIGQVISPHTESVEELTKLVEKTVASLMEESGVKNIRIKEYRNFTELQESSKSN